MLLIADITRCPNFCEDCGDVDQKFLDLGKMRYFTEQHLKEGGRELADKLKGSCVKGLIKERG